MKKNMKLFIVLKVEYGAGEENAFSEVLQITSSKSTAETFKAHYEEQFEDEIHNAHNKRWVSTRSTMPTTSAGYPSACTRP